MGASYLLQKNQHILPKAKRESAILNIIYLFTKYTPLNIMACLVIGAASGHNHLHEILVYGKLRSTYIYPVCLHVQLSSLLNKA